LTPRRKLDAGVDVDLTSVMVSGMKRTLPVVLLALVVAITCIPLAAFFLWVQMAWDFASWANRYLDRRFS